MRVHLLLNTGRQIGFEYAHAIVLESDFDCFGINNCRILGSASRNARGRYCNDDYISDMHADSFTKLPRIDNDNSVAVVFTLKRVSDRRICVS